ncbi:MAG: hypothetical protein GX127_02730 [Eubacteriaceae bacterium]|nr:hypothetical protein [Eubacteriaceae bacterium]
MSQLPLRFSILKILHDDDNALTPFELYEKVKTIYPNEKQATVDALDGHLMSMRGAGLITVEKAHLTEESELVSSYKLTDYGKEKVEQYIL